jgi:preprotein translocase subunit YajC
MNDFLISLMSSILALGIVFSIILIIYYVLSSRGMSKRREAMRRLVDELKPGKKVLFAGGLVGRIVSVREEYLDIELNKNNVVTVSRYAVSEIIND